MIRKRRRRKRGPRRIIRSKVEEYIEKKIRRYYPQVELKCNDKSALRLLEIDLYFPSLSLGIEINGKCHREPIFGKRVFAKTCRNDKAKRTACRNKSIDLHTIDYYGSKFTDKIGQEYWLKVREILREEIKKKCPTDNQSVEEYVPNISAM